MTKNVIILKKCLIIIALLACSIESSISAQVQAAPRGRAAPHRRSQSSFHSGRSTQKSTVRKASFSSTPRARQNNVRRARVQQRSPRRQTSSRLGQNTHSINKQKTNRAVRRTRQTQKATKSQARLVKSRRANITASTARGGVLVGRNGTAIGISLTSSPRIFTTPTSNFWGRRCHFRSAWGSRCWFYPSFGLWFYPNWGCWYYPWLSCWYFPYDYCWYYPSFGYYVRLYPDDNYVVIKQRRQKRNLWFAIYEKRQLATGITFEQIEAPRPVGLHSKLHLKNRMRDEVLIISHHENDLTLSLNEREAGRLTIIDFSNPQTERVSRNNSNQEEITRFDDINDEDFARLEKLGDNIHEDKLEQIDDIK